ncbi:MAG: pyrroline-5-carboxylate reductase [Pseudomonadota bacterium]
MMNTAFNPRRPLVLAGCGNMGGAMLEAWLAGGLAGDAIRVIEPAGAARALAAGLAAARVTAAPVAGERAGVLVLAVKPQQVAASLAELAPAIDEETLVMSIAAGKTLASLRAGAPPAGAIVRAMPNTPAAIGQGVSVLCAERAASPAQRQAAADLLAGIGAVHWVKDEALMDVVTALSGSGPAYVFYLIECLAAAGQAHGLSPEIALALATETVAGAGALARHSSEAPAALRRQVTTPGGTAQAGLEELMRDKGGLAELIRRTISASAKRSKELSAPA